MATAKTTVSSRCSASRVLLGWVGGTRAICGGSATGGSRADTPRTGLPNHPHHDVVYDDAATIAIAQPPQRCLNIHLSLPTHPCPHLVLALSNMLHNLHITKHARPTLSTPPLTTPGLVGHGDSPCTLRHVDIVVVILSLLALAIVSCRHSACSLLAPPSPLPM